jgi:hypothetical protein
MTKGPNINSLQELQGSQMLQAIKEDSTKEVKYL